jgi:hypothetical protein
MRGVTAVKTFPNKTKAKEWGWREDVGILDELIGRLKV